MSSRTGARTTAREAARLRQATANQDRRQRDEAELQHSTEFELARQRRDEATAAVVAAELEMARAAQALLELDNPVSRVAELTAESESELRRLRKHLVPDDGLAAPTRRGATLAARSRRSHTAPNDTPISTVSQPASPADR